MVRFSVGAAGDLLEDDRHVRRRSCPRTRRMRPPAAHLCPEVVSRRSRGEPCGGRRPPPEVGENGQDVSTRPPEPLAAVARAIGITTNPDISSWCPTNE